MARFRLEQRAIKFFQLGIQKRQQAVEALTGTRLDKGTNDQRINQLARFLAAHMLVQPLGILGSTELAVLDAALAHDGCNLLKVAQLLARQTRHLLLQILFFRIPEH